MRLIDADALIEAIKKQKDDNDYLCRLCIDATNEIIDEQPTAYDIEAVVEELEKASSEIYGHIKILSLNKAIEIARKGGVKNE